MRLAAVLLRDDDKAMEHRVCADERTATMYADASTWLKRESEYLRKTARVFDKTVQRVNVVLERCRFQASSTAA